MILLLDVGNSQIFGGVTDDPQSVNEPPKFHFRFRKSTQSSSSSDEIGLFLKSVLKENNINPNKKPTKAQQVEATEEVLLPAVRNQVDGIRALGLPSEGEEEADAVLKAAEKGLEEAEEDPSSVATENGKQFAEANKLAREFGLTTCGEEG